MAFVRHPLVAAPPQEPAISLLTSSYRPDPQTEVGLDGVAVGNRWEEGFSWRPRSCPGISGRNECGTLTTVAYRTDSDDGGDDEVREHQPVILSATYSKSAISADWEFFKQAAFDALTAAEAVAAEQELWEGTLARAAIAAGDHAYDKNLWLTKYQVAEKINTTAVSAKAGIALLENYLGEHGSGGPGAIHLSPELMPWIGVRVEGRRVLTNRNTLVIPGGGYSGLGPASSSGGAPVAPTAGQAWIYCTGLTTYRNGPIIVTPEDESQGLNRKTNTATAKAERSSAGTWDSCFVGAALVTLPV